MEPRRSAQHKVLHAVGVLAIEVLLTALAWFVLNRLGQPQASFPVTMAVWTFCLVIYAVPVQAAIAARSRGRSLTWFLLLAGVGIWAATSTTHLPSMFPMVMGIAAVELAERDSSWRTAGTGLLVVVLGTVAMEWFVETGLVPSAFAASTSHHLAVILALFGCLLIVRGFGRARQAAALRHDLAEEQARRHAELRHAITYDPLTGALSRRGLHDVLAGPVGNAAGLAVIYLDLNGFKAVNDEHGHDVGDALLTRVSARFAQVVPERGVLARVGGDEFVVVVPQVPSPELASALTGRLRARLDTAVELPLADAGASLTVSVGVSAGSSWSPRPPEDVELLMRAADRGMYEDKRAVVRPGAQRATETYPVPVA